MSEAPNNEDCEMTMTEEYEPTLIERLEEERSSISSEDYAGKQFILFRAWFDNVYDSETVGLHPLQPGHVYASLKYVRDTYPEKKMSTGVPASVFSFVAIQDSDWIGEDEVLECVAYLWYIWGFLDCKLRNSKRIADHGKHIVTLCLLCYRDKIYTDSVIDTLPYMTEWFSAIERRGEKDALYEEWVSTLSADHERLKEFYSSIQTSTSTEAKSAIEKSEIKLNNAKSRCGDWLIQWCAFTVSGPLEKYRESVVYESRYNIFQQIILSMSMNNCV